MASKSIHRGCSLTAPQKYLLPVVALLFFANCFSSEKALPGITGTGQISGKVVGPDGQAIAGVTLNLTHNGQVLQATSSSNGLFSFSLPEVERGTGFNVHLSKTNFEDANYAAVISLPNLKVDMGNLVMYIVGSSAELTLRKITGMLFDNFSYVPLAGANVTTVDSAGHRVTVITDATGKFSLESNYFALGNTFVVEIYKNNYITRSDITALITGEINETTNYRIRLYQKFGAIHAYVYEDTLTNTPLDGVTASLTSSNNRQLQCTTGGAYDSTPLAVGKYCPDLTGVTSPFTSPPNNNSGGVKFQNDFIFLGSRYNVDFTKTNPGCTTRNDTASQCYRPATAYADVRLVGDNPISGTKISLKWDAWIYGTVIVQDPNIPSGFCPASGSCPGAGCTCIGSGVTVKLYKNSTFITQTTSDATGKFILDHPQIARDPASVPYEITFEREKLTSRLLGGGSTDTTPVQVTLPLTSNVVGPLYGAGANKASGSCAGGAICMKALPAPTHCVQGTVKDYWNPAKGVKSATVRILDSGFGWRNGTTDTMGHFVIYGNFNRPPARTGNRIAYSSTVTGLGSVSDLNVGMMVGGTGIQPGTTITSINTGALTLQLSAPATASAADNLSFNQMHEIELSAAGYTGENDVNKQAFKFAHDGTAACPGAPYKLSDTGATACEPQDVGPTGGHGCEDKLKLFPKGIFAVLNGVEKEFKSQIKQTYEKFLTEKVGLTISARSRDLMRVPQLPEKTYDADAMYLHFDDTPRLLPPVIEGKWSNHVPVNPTADSPIANGSLTESIGTDTRIIPWEIKTYIYYNFYAAAPGTYTIETTGSTDTYITVYSQTGSNLGSDNDSGTGSNARLSLSLSRGWYYVKVRGKDDNVFGFFNVNVSGPPQTEANYSPMISASYGTNCAPNDGNLVISWYDSVNHLMYIAAPGENGGCTVSANIQKHGANGEIIRGSFGGVLRPVAPSGATVTVKNAGQQKGFFNIVRME